MADISSLSVFAVIQDSGLRITFDTNIRWRDEELDLRCGDYGQPDTSRRAGFNGNQNAGRLSAVACSHTQ